MVDRLDAARSEQWISHGLQLFLQLIGVIVVVVGPMMWWAMSEERDIGALTARVDALALSLQTEHTNQQGFQTEMRGTMTVLSGSVGVLQGLLQERGKDTRR
jgi:hypothetical protein